MSFPHRQLLPEGLAQMPPGPRLGAALAEIDPARLVAIDAEVYMRACYRQVSYEQARFMEAMVWFGLCRPAPDEVVAHDTEPSPAASDEVRASLRWTRQTAERQFYLALDLRDRLPHVFQALWEGRIDLPRARVLAEWTQELTPEQAQRICGTLLPGAADMTTGELIATVKQMAIAIDPDWAKRRYEQAVRTRRVVGRRDPDGTASLSGLCLPLDQTAAASARIEKLARQAKNAGDGRPIDQVRADLFLGLLDGTYTGWDTEQIIADLVGRHDQEPAQCEAPVGTTTSPRPEEPTRKRPTAATPCPRPGEPADTTRSPQPEEPQPRKPQPGKPRPGKPRPATPFPQPDESGKAREATGPTEPCDPGDRQQSDSDPKQPRHRPAAGATDRRRDQRAGVELRDQRAGVELRVRLSTLLGLDRYPAEIAGWGHTHAENARVIAAAQTGAPWRYAICDQHGQLLYDGLISSRPRGYPARTRVRGIVEIQIPLSLLKALCDDPGRHPEWAQVIAQITADFTAHHQHREPGGRPGGRSPTREPTTGSGADDAHGRDRRFPNAPMRRSLQVRDRKCGFPGCRMPARDSELDHLRQWQSHGRTQEHNLTSLCRHDHALKDQHGWKLTMTTDGTLRWTSRLGLTYTVRRTPVIIDLPTPHHCRPTPTITPDDQAPAEGDTTPIWTGPEHSPGNTATSNTVTGNTVTGNTEDRSPLLTDDEKPPF